VIGGWQLLTSAKIVDRFFWGQPSGIVAQLNDWVRHVVVTVDTSVAHLAGGLGKRTLVLIPAVNTDWRWLHDRDDSPWYPSARLYRADPMTGWSPAIERLVQDVRAMAGEA